MNDSIEVLKNKISSYEYILETQQDDLKRTRTILKDLKRKLSLVNAETTSIIDLDVETNL